ncbi:MAG: glycosyltransferase [Christensenellales bacterium]
MKIVIVIELYDLMTNGTVMSAHRFADELKKRGHTVRIVATGAKGEGCFEVRERYLPIATEVARLQQVRFGKPDYETLTNAFSGADIVHLYMPFKLEKKALKIAKQMGIPVTAAFHVQPENITYNAGLRHSSIAAKWFYAYFRDNFFKNVDHIHCPSQFIAQQLQDRKYRANMHVISNGVSDEFRPPAEYKQLDPENINIMMTGRFATEKRQDVLIKAISMSKYADKIHLTLAGKGPKLAKLKKLADKYLVNPVRFGFFNRDELIEQIHNTDLYVHAADVEIEAIACIEAFACGVVPIIANSAKSATPQFALDERSLFEAGNPKDLAAKIDYWIEHPKEKEEMSKAYIAQGEKYNISYSIDKAEEMFKEAINTAREKRRMETKEAKKKGKYFVSKNKVTHVLSGLLYYLVGIPVFYLFCSIYLGLRIKGRKNLKKAKGKGVVSISNHVHLLDCAMNALALWPRRIQFTVLYESFNMPVAGKMLKFLGAVPTPQNVAEARVFKHEINTLLKDDKTVHIYAEAHLVNYYAGIREFNKGAFKIACDSQVPIIPIVISWRKRRGLYKLCFTSKPCATITVGEPIYPNLQLFSKEMYKDIEERTTKAMKDLYDNSNYGMSINYFEGKEAPTEFKTKYQLKQMEEENGEIKKTNKVRQTVGKILHGLKQKDKLTVTHDEAHQALQQAKDNDIVQGATDDNPSKPVESEEKQNDGEVVE